jgi:hypothetical protein
MTLGLPVYVPFSCDIFPSALVSSNDFVKQIHTRLYLESWNDELTILKGCGHELLR